MKTNTNVVFTENQKHCYGYGIHHGKFPTLINIRVSELATSRCGSEYNIIYLFQNYKNNKPLVILTGLTVLMLGEMSGSLNNIQHEENKY